MNAKSTNMTFEDFFNQPYPEVSDEFLNTFAHHEEQSAIKKEIETIERMRPATISEAGERKRLLSDLNKSLADLEREYLSSSEPVEPTAAAPGGSTEVKQNVTTWQESARTIADDGSNLAKLFDPVKIEQLEAMFPDDGKWASYAERAERNGLKKCARVGRGLFNPFRAAEWWIKRGPVRWKWEQCLRKLANNLPTRSRDSRNLLTGEYE